MKHEQLLAILADIKIFDRLFIATPSDRGGWHLQVTYPEADVETGQIEPQYSRKWFIEPDATESDVVATAYAATRRSYKHVVQEHFTYKGHRVFSPHFTVDQRLRMCEESDGVKRTQQIVEGKARRSIAQSITEVILGSFEFVLRMGKFDDADVLLTQLNIATLPPEALLSALSITFHAKDKLKNRETFLVQVEARLRADLGDVRTEDLLKHRR
jgi:hypothetical protein